MKTLRRQEGWEHRLHDFVQSRKDLSFKWGAHDCCAFTAGAIEAVTGVNPMGEHRAYSSAAGAAHVLSDCGGVTGLPAAHGLHELGSAKEAQRGDVVWLWSDAGRPGRSLPSIGICLGQLSAFCGRPGGVQYVPTIDCDSAWRIE